MPYHGLRRWSRSEMQQIANELSRSPKFCDGEIVNTKRTNGCLCEAEIIKSWRSGNSYVYSVRIIGRDINDRETRAEKELWK